MCAAFQQEQTPDPKRPRFVAKSKLEIDNNTIGNITFNEKDLKKETPEVQKDFQVIKEAGEKGIKVYYDYRSRSYQLYINEPKFTIGEPFKSDGNPFDSEHKHAHDISEIAQKIKPHLAERPIKIFSRDQTLEVRAIDHSNKDYLTFKKAEQNNLRIYLESVEKIRVESVDEIRETYKTRKTYQIYKRIDHPQKKDEKQEIKVAENETGTIIVDTGYQLDEIAYRNSCLASALRFQLNDPKLPTPKIISSFDTKGTLIDPAIISQLDLRPLSRLDCTKKDMPEFFELSSHISRRGYEIWVKSINQGKIELLVVDKGDKTVSKELKYIGDPFLIHKSEIGSKKMCEQIKEIIQQNSEYLNRDALIENVDLIVQDKNIHKMIADTSETSKICNFKRGDEIRYGNALFYFLQRDFIVHEIMPLEAHQSRMPLLHTLQRINQYDKDFFNGLTKEQLKEFTIELLKKIIRDKNSLMNTMIIDSDTKLIAILGTEPVGTKDGFDLQDFKSEVTKRYKIPIKNQIIFKAEPDKHKENEEKLADFLKEVKKAAIDPTEQRTAVWTWMHGNPVDLQFEGNTRLTVNALSKALSTRQELTKNNNVSVLLDQCDSYGFARSLVAQLSANRKTEDEPIPLTISSSLKNNVSWAQFYQGKHYSSLNNRIDQFLPKDRDKLSVADLFDIDRNDYQRNQRPIIEGWHYKVEDNNIAYTLGEDITVFDKNLIQSSKLIRDVCSMLLNENRPSGKIEIDTSRLKQKTDSAPLEISNGLPDPVNN